MLIDSHHHLWKYSDDQYGWINDSMSVLRRDFSTEQLRELAVAHRVDGFVSVQARQSVAETEALLAMADAEPLIRGVVGWAPLAGDVRPVLEQFADRPALKGMRHVVQDEPDDQFLLGKAFNEGVRELYRCGLVYDVLVYAKQLPTTIAFVDLHPDHSMILDHIAKPTIRSNEFDQTWADNLRKLAERPHVMCKFSGMATEVRDADWSIDTVRPYWDTVVDAFTPARLMFGSDWPVCLLKTDYGRWLDCVGELAAELTADEQNAIFAGNAIRAYGL
jgi:L-fuconolactonase